MECWQQIEIEKILIMGGNSLNALGKRLNRTILSKVPFFNVADIITAVQFDHTGDYLATGDYGGRIVLFERNDGVR